MLTMKKMIVTLSQSKNNTLDKWILVWVLKMSHWVKLNYEPRIHYAALCSCGAGECNIKIDEVKIIISKRLVYMLNTFWNEVSSYLLDLVSLAANGSQPPCRTLFNFGKYIFFQDIKGSGIFLFPVGVVLLRKCIHQSFTHMDGQSTGTV